MPLLELRGVNKRYGRGAQEQIALIDVSLAVEAGELVAVWGRRRSGRSTLLRVAAGLERADEGEVMFDGRALSTATLDGARPDIRFCRKSFRPAEGQTVLEQLVTGQLTRGTPMALARTRARDALRRVGAERAAPLSPVELDASEAIRVAIARAIAPEPKLLVIDEPTLGVDMLLRDEILALLRSLANEGVAVLMSATDTSSLAGSDRALSLTKGKLSGEVDAPEMAPVIPLRLVTPEDKPARESQHAP